MSRTVSNLEALQIISDQYLDELAGSDTSDSSLAVAGEILHSQLQEVILAMEKQEEDA
jgi:hypothetical protein